jgi:hypothetical protein
MKTLIIIIFGFAFHNVCNAQSTITSTVDKKVESRIQELRDKKTDTIICYYVDCIGSIYIIKKDSCSTYRAKYLLWANNGQYLIQRFDDCSDYKPLVLGSSFFRILNHYYNKIEHDKLEYPKYTIWIEGKKQTYYTMIDHSCHTIFEIVIGNKVLKKDLDEYALETKYIDGKYLNLNYSRNKQSYLNKLKIIVEKKVSIYNK